MVTSYKTAVGKGRSVIVVVILKWRWWFRSGVDWWWWWWWRKRERDCGERWLMVESGTVKGGEMVEITGFGTQNCERKGATV